jgi:hypothetical protein
VRTGIVVRVLLLAATCAIRPLVAQSGVGDSAIIFGAHHAFSVRAPAGWILDVRSQRNNGVPAVLYRRGETWQAGPAVMYVNTIVPDSGVADPLRRVIRADSVRFADAIAGMRVDTAATLRTADNRAAFTRSFHGDSGNLELVAYVPSRPIITLFVLSARTRPAFDAARSSFEALVRSYRFLTDRVTVRPAPTD